MDKTTIQELLKLQVLLEASIKLQSRIIAQQEGLDFDTFHKELLNDIDKQICKLLQTGKQ